MRSLRSPAASVVCALLLASACRSGGSLATPRGPERPQTPAPVLEAPPGWRTASAFGFEELALAWPPADAAGPLDEASLAELRAALAESTGLAVRAAVLLARSGDPRAGVALLERLEQRVEHGERHADAGDVVAAGALWDWPCTADAAQRLAALADGPGKHPDLEVRIECAAAALHAGHDELVPFLLRVLHADTPAQLEDPPDWPPTRTMAWSKSRAAEILSRRAGLEPAFRPDGSYAHQIAEAERLARALGR